MENVKIKDLKRSLSRYLFRGMNVKRVGLRIDVPSM